MNGGRPAAGSDGRAAREPRSAEGARGWLRTPKRAAPTVPMALG